MIYPQHGHIDIDAVLDNLEIKVGGDNELGASGDGLVDLLNRQNGAGAHGHLRICLAHGANAIRGGIGAERDLGGAHARSHQGICHGNSLSDIVQNHNRNNSKTLELLVKGFKH